MSRQGAALIEVLIALVILASAGVSTLGYLTALADARGRLDAREQEMSSAENVLASTSLLTAGELDLRLGVRQVGVFSVTVGRPEPRLYRIGVAVSSNPASELLATIVFRPETAP